MIPNILAQYRRIRAGWTGTDSVVALTNLFALLVLIANTVVESTAVCYLAAGLPLAVQAVVSWNRSTLSRAYWFGAGVGLTWPLAEGVIVRTFGWWGQYLGGGLLLWDTTAYTVVVGWLTCAYLAYLVERVRELKYSPLTVVMVTAGSATFLGVLGENLCVWGRMWEYERTTWMWFDVPAFIPVSYGLSYACLPVVRRLPVLVGAVVFNVLTSLIGCTLGMLTGFVTR